MKNKSPFNYFSTLIQKRCEIYSQVAQYLLTIEETLETREWEKLLDAFEKIRRIIRTSLPFLTEQIFFELERLEALILPHKNKPSGLSADELKTRFAILHVQFSKALKSTETQDMEEILSLPKEIRKQIKNSERELLDIKEETKKREQASELAREAEKFAEEKNFKRAVKNFQKAIQLWPDQAVYHNDLGVVYAYQNMLEKAMEEYQRATQINEQKPEQRTPQWTLTYFNLGKIYKRLGDQILDRKIPVKEQLEGGWKEYEKAIQALEEFLKLTSQGDKADQAKSLIHHLREEISLLKEGLDKLGALVLAPPLIERTEPETKEKEKEETTEKESLE